MGSLQIITAVLGFFLLVSIGVFIFSFIFNWGKLFTVFWALAAILCAHLLLYCLVVYVEPANMPPLLSRYILGIVDSLEKLNILTN
jgi:hypothetical protein